MASDALSADAGTKLCAAADVFPDKIKSALSTLKGKFGDRRGVGPYF